jgi:type II secretory pathway component PulF
MGVFPLSSPMPPRLIAEVFGRLAVAAAAGIPPLKAWRSEAERVPPRWRAAVQRVAAALAAGESMEDALASAGETFPPEVRAMVAAAERAGRDAEVYREIASSSRIVAQALSRMRQGLVWPAVQLALAVAVCGLLIFVSGETVDLLGLGLVGGRGLAVYGAVLAATGAVLAWVLHAAGVSWKRRGAVRRLVAAIPAAGGTLAAWELAAWCRAAALAAWVGLDAGRLVRLAGTAAPGLACDDRAVVAALAAGDTLAAALARQGIFQGERGRRVLVAIDVGEQSGTTAETLGRLGEQLLAEAADGLRAVAAWAGHAVWVVVAVLAATMIIRVVGSYANLLQGLAR